MSGLREKHGITIHAGSVAERDGDDFYNATVVFGPNGRQIAPLPQDLISSTSARRRHQLPRSPREIHSSGITQ